MCQQQEHMKTDETDFIKFQSTVRKDSNLQNKHQTLQVLL